MKGRIIYKKAADIGAIILIALELVLFVLMHLRVGGMTSYWQYSAVLLAFLFSLFSIKGEHRGHLVVLGLAFTLVADYFLVLRGDAQLGGVIAFCFAQLAYLAYIFLTDDRKGIRLTNILTRVGLCTLLIIAAYAVLGDGVDALAVASVIYYSNLAVNTVFAFLLGKKGRVFAIGLVLFAACDLLLGLGILGDAYLDTDAFDFVFGYFNLPWVFYQPSQVMIALSVYSKIQEK